GGGAAGGVWQPGQWNRESRPFEIVCTHIRWIVGRHALRRGQFPAIPCHRRERQAALVVCRRRQRDGVPLARAGGEPPVSPRRYKFSRWKREPAAGAAAMMRGGWTAGYYGMESPGSVQASHGRLR